ncbi:MAG: hypothetical protein CMP31_07490 [Roseibacillus sp.]|nr:hypothetical protein [Roseibacillus sp.]
MVEGSLLVFHLGNKLRQKGLHLIQLALVDLEIGMDTDDAAVIGHIARIGGSNPGGKGETDPAVIPKNENRAPGKSAVHEGFVC